MLSQWIADGSGIVGILTGLFSLHAWRVRLWRTRAQKLEAAAEDLRQANEDLRHQITGLRTVALVDERIRALMPKGQTDDGR